MFARSFSLACSFLIDREHWRLANVNKSDGTLLDDSLTAPFASTDSLFTARKLQRS